MRHGIAIALLASCCLTGCGSDRHIELVKSGANLQSARSDLAACTYTAETSLGVPPSGWANPIAHSLWSDQRDHLANLCLQGKGYALNEAPGPCQGACEGKVGLPN
jgi:hypothetical protein